MNTEREQIIDQVKQILSEKSFTEKANHHLLQSILFVYDHYSPPLYIDVKREDYIAEYLEILKNMKGYTPIGLDELNFDYEPFCYFRKNIVLCENKSGNLEYVDGKYVSTRV